MDSRKSITASGVPTEEKSSVAEIRTMKTWILSVRSSTVFDKEPKKYYISIFAYKKI